MNLPARRGAIKASLRKGVFIELDIVGEDVAQSAIATGVATLVLIGAGIFGKIYCAAAKRSGGVALDMGSAFDILAGKLTRPANSDPAFFDLERFPFRLSIFWSVARSAK
jgi:hypothetical protein